MDIHSAQYDLYIYITLLFIVLSIFVIIKLMKSSSKSSMEDDLD